MAAIQFIKRQVKQIQQGGSLVLLRKIKLFATKSYYIPIYILAIPAVLIIRLIKPWLLVRLGGLHSTRIGHFAANTELYLCERAAGVNVPNQRHIDIFYMGGKPVCNQQLATMWKRVLRIWPAWLVAPIDQINRLIPSGESHEIGKNANSDRDILNLLDRVPPHLQFTAEETARGEDGLRAMGIPAGVPFVCLAVRDSAYLASQLGSIDFSYHDYRDSDVQNYVLAAEALANRGYYVIRMGAKVREPINSTHTNIIDYATNGMRSDFMDIYLGSKCEFCITVGTGYDAVPYIFRRPIVYVNLVPVAYLPTFRAQYIGIFKHHIDSTSNNELSLSEIFIRGVGFCMRSSDYKAKGVTLVENTPQEIRNVVIESAERIAGTWKEHPADNSVQRSFWEIYLAYVVKDSAGKPLHGEIRGRFGAAYLRDNPHWLR